MKNIKSINEWFVHFTNAKNDKDPIVKDLREICLVLDKEFEIEFWIDRVSEDEKSYTVLISREINQPEFKFKDIESNITRIKKYMSSLGYKSSSEFYSRHGQIDQGYLQDLDIWKLKAVKFIFKK